MTEKAHEKTMTADEHVEKQNRGAQTGTMTETTTCLQGSHRYFPRKTPASVFMLQLALKEQIEMTDDERKEPLE